MECVECGRCVAICSYSAIVKHTKPCVNACKVNAIPIDKDTQKAIIIKDEKYISCGACIYHYPFGAIMDKSYITQAIRMIRESDSNKIYAVVAPSLVSQYANIPEITTGKVVTAIIQVEFHSVIEGSWSR